MLDVLFYKRADTENLWALQEWSPPMSPPDDTKPEPAADERELCAHSIDKFWCPKCTPAHLPLPSVKTELPHKEGSGSPAYWIQHSRYNDMNAKLYPYDTPDEELLKLYQKMLMPLELYVPAERLKVAERERDEAREKLEQARDTFLGDLLEQSRLVTEANARAEAAEKRCRELEACRIDSRETLAARERERDAALARVEELEAQLMVTRVGAGHYRSERDIHFAETEAFVAEAAARITQLNEQLSEARRGLEKLVQIAPRVSENVEHVKEYVAHVARETLGKLK